MMSILFTAMKKPYIDSVVEIENQSFPTPWTKSAFFHEIAANDFAHYIVALEGDKVAGYGGMWVILDEAHITTLAVNPAYRRQKIGSRLLYELIAEAGRRGCLRMTLEVRPSNLPALDLYRKTGFVSYGVRPGYYSDTGEDAVIMWKELEREL